MASPPHYFTENFLISTEDKVDAENVDDKERCLGAASALIDAFPEYVNTLPLDELRATEYKYLDAQNHVYLDYTGSSLAALAQHRAHEERLMNNLFGNPHSSNPTSEAATHLITQTRARILMHLNAPPSEYAVIFTSNATGAARLVGESYPFSRRNRLVLTTDNHNSINGLREFARHAGAKTFYIPAEPPELRVDSAKLTAVLQGRRLHCLPRRIRSNTRRGLFAFPAQSNFSGVQHPLSFIAIAQEQGYDVLLDAAAYLPAATLDLSIIKPEFLIISWYKLFGFPTGVGCLIAKHSALARLSRPWFSGGSIKAVAVTMPWHEMASDESAFEDGTLNFLSIPDVLFGLDWLQLIGLDVITTRVRCLTGWFLDKLIFLKHSDGSPMTRLYGPKDIHARGGTITFNFLDAAGNIVDERLVALESSAARISLRTGCFCNPGVAENALGLVYRNLLPLWRRAKTKSLDEIISLIGLPSGGAIRVSFGLVSNAADVERFFAFVNRTYKDRITTGINLPPRERC